ncbi:MAG: citrate lyase holo-[acyl-carrier protein] synthase [Treponema sp.]|nr:citrate lyase holo-[acyl-carrier protein] synthase [Treponema sp.]
MKEPGKTDPFAGCAATGLEEVLAEREDRARRQEELRRRFGPPLLCLTLNIPGPYKNFPWARRCFFAGIKALKDGLRAGEIDLRHEESSEGPAGYRAFIAAAAEGSHLKAIALHIEETHPLGRLFDIDILDGEGKITRAALGAETRKCLICGGSAFACGRSRAHTVEELTGAVVKIMENFFRENLSNIISGAALGALMGEAAVTPKPGLVDRANSGAHRDMDFFTFINSTAAILPYFRDCALEGLKSGSGPVELFNSLRFRGKIAELDMRNASGGVNTHRGLIFSLGILSAAFGRLYRREETPGLEDTLELCRLMTARLHEDFSRAGADTNGGPGGLSHGEALYKRHGLSGIRGEASRGFPTVRNTAYPALCGLLDAGHCLNDAGAAVFLHLLAETEDTNIVHRSDPGELRRIQQETAAFLAARPSMEDMLKKAGELDGEFIRRRISPGGSADLLAVTLFLYRLLHRCG